MSRSDFAREHFRRVREKAARELEDAEREAAASGKEPFDLKRLNELLGQAPDSDLSCEHDLRENYYVVYRSLRTLADYARLRRELEMWEE